MLTLLLQLTVMLMFIQVLLRLHVVQVMTVMVPERRRYERLRSPRRVEHGGGHPFHVAVVVRLEVVDVVSAADRRRHQHAGRLLPLEMRRHEETVAAVMRRRRLKQRCRRRVVVERRRRRGGAGRRTSGAVERGVARRGGDRAGCCLVVVLLRTTGATSSGDASVMSDRSAGTRLAVAYKDRHGDAFCRRAARGSVALLLLVVIVVEMMMRWLLVELLAVFLRLLRLVAMILEPDFHLQLNNTILITFSDYLALAFSYLNL